MRDTGAEFYEVMAQRLRERGEVPPEPDLEALERRTEGWVAVGFDPSSRMKDANFLIGYVEDGQAFLSDQYGSGQTSHDSDESLGGTSDFSNLDGAEEEGLTWLSFTIPLDSGDRYDRPLSTGNSYKVILAAGSSDGYGGYHGGKRTSVTMRL